MKKLIVFDLDGTLSESKSALDAEMTTLLTALLGIVEVAVISGVNWLQFKEQLLAKEHLRVLRYRSPEPVLTPELPQERWGTIANVVFPTGIDWRDDLGMPNRFDVYDGMADNRISVARLDMPDFLPPEGVADPPEAKM